MASVRFFIALVLVALGCALLIAASEPRLATAQWVGTGSHGSQSLFFVSARDHNRPQHVMPSLAPSQLTLNFEPTLTERFSSLREYLAHRVQVQPKPAKTIAMDMDMSPSTLSRKLTAGLLDGDKDTQRFNVDDLEAFIRATGDTTAIEYLAAKYLHSDEHRKTRAIARVEEMASELARALASLKGGA